MTGYAPWTVAVGASGSEGLQDLRDLLREWPDLDAVVMIVLHRPWTSLSRLREVLQRSSRMSVVIAVQGERLQPGRVYIGEPASHLTLISRTEGTVTPDPDRMYGNRTVDLLFKSLVAFGGMRIMGIVLEGSLDDGSRGLAAIHDAGGLTMVITPNGPPAGMPGNAISYDGPVDVIGDIKTIAQAVEDTVSGRRRSS
ncbi:chemotaxis protein CheB [Frigidibacter sp.]|uniref:chemotaxis protein CheB n=1 Tax=Frigidibacter sp. TaxID=2586418 RepID=UPI0027324392|nr:chemotaxis protein CheB [Frigidibacter sp.]MDP3342817.1 chemotaxis protein CheB [Frigidibacter sp.]